MFSLPVDRPAVMGVLNVTPDSFSDGGAYATTALAIEAGRRMADEGADLIDVGGESTRPGAEPVLPEEEFRRVLPVVEGLVKAGYSVSIDTMKASVARAAVGAGAEVVNDVSAMGDPEMLEVVAGTSVTLCLMHMQGTPKTMQLEPRYDNVVSEVRKALLSEAGRAQAGGVNRERIWLDPGIGFGKSDAHNFELLANLGVLVDTCYPILIGVSRKGFLGRLLGGAAIHARLPAALAIQSLAQAAGVKVIRTHDVLETRQAVAGASALRGAETSS
ncbi:MAG: dihydropteroate synthase [Fimbriimonadaceae bacterium]